MTVLKQYNGSSWQPVAVGAQGLTGVQGTSGPQGVQGVQGATPSGGGMTLLSTTSLSGISTIITGISQSYTNLFLIVNWNSSNPGYGELKVQWNGSTGQSLVGSYRDDGYVNQSVNGTLSSRSGGGAGNPVCHQITLTNYTNTSYYKMGIATTSYGTNLGYGGSIDNIQYASTSAVTSITFGMSESFASGTVLLYGVN
jgi:hypothetical protein